MPPKLFLMLFPFALVNLLQGQTLWTSPPGFLSIEGDDHASQFGAFKDHRVMLFDGEVAGLRLMKRVMFRPSFLGDRTMARSWTGVTLEVSPCDLGRLSTMFSQNPMTTPTRVFSQAVAWPVLRPQRALPNPWSFVFPFRTMFVKNAGRDIGMDFDFRGGAMIPSWPSHGVPYDLDGLTQQSKGVSEGNRMVYHKAWSCTDSAWYWPAFHRLFASVYSSGPYAGSAFAGMFSQQSAPGQPVVYALGLNGNAQGWTFPGVDCNRLHLDPRAPMMLFTRTTDRIGGARVDFGPFAHQPQFEGVSMWGQAVWSDSKTGRPLLTNGSQTVFPRMPRAYKRRVLVQTDPSKKHASGRFVEPEPWFPITAYGN